MVFAAISLLTGAALVGLSIWLRIRSHQAHEWPTVKGHVIECRVDDTNLEMMKPVLRYCYEVDGQRFVGFRVSFSGYGVSKGAIKQLIKPYPLNAVVKVYYNPRDPSSAVLNNSAKSDWLYWLLFGVSFLSLAAYLAWP